MARPMSKSNKQAGKVLRRLDGDSVHIIHPDRARPALRAVARPFPCRQRAYGSHVNGRHKLG